MRFAYLLPLSRRRRRRRRAIVYLVRVTGTSTGFAFDRIQRDSVAITESLVNHGHPFATSDNHRRHGWLDQVFLRVAERRPACLGQAMVGLFAKQSAAPVLAFLDEDSTLREEVCLIRHMPYEPFLRAALC